jgi:nitrogen fixation protein NifB
VTSKVLTPEEALERVREVSKHVHYIKVIAVAGPGEPLFSEETFETFRLVKEEFPHLMRCLSTNGLLLPDRIKDLEELGIGTLTVTLNAVDPAIGEDIYSFVNYCRISCRSYRSTSSHISHRQRPGRRRRCRINAVSI